MCKTCLPQTPGYYGQELNPRPGIPNTWQITEPKADMYGNNSSYYGISDTSGGPFFVQYFGL